MAVEILCPNINGAVISMNVDALNRIDNVTVDTTLATEQVRIWYPEDGSKAQATIPKGQVVSQDFQGANRLTRFTQQVVVPGTGQTVTVWTSPTWVAWSP